MGIEDRVTQLDPRHLEDFTACLEVGCARFAKQKFSHIIEIKRNWIRFTCVLLVHYKISLLFFHFFSFIFASNFSLRFDLVIFASKFLLHIRKNLTSIQYIKFCFNSILLTLFRFPISFQVKKKHFYQFFHLIFV